ncbi:unnamed protein product [Eruca vesicaria subsp. sativa]|uniref:Uncharacterized protein n=1 Tax=Eruca vesicaria subsp. sativa TaxID=29727 RepID=A0ABC8KYQ6_ERUVS|nr:unnamed protein product [Eruca vesicaria subsp. sativa]
MALLLNLRLKQLECVLRMLNLNKEPLDQSVECFKVLIYDDFCKDVIAPLIGVKELRRQRVTLQLPIHDNERKHVPTVAVYFVQPTETNIQRIIADVTSSLYDTFHLNFSSSIPRPLLEDLASGTLHHCNGSIESVHDQYLEFVTLEDNLFSLSQQNVYAQLNDPSATGRDIEEMIEKIASGLFDVLATLGVVPVIRCPVGGPAEMVASSLDKKLRYHLLCKNNLMSSFQVQRPLLCIFDRNFDLSVGIQHDFRYRPLVHDLLGLKLNALIIPGAAQKKKIFLDTCSDPFWSANASLEFPQVAGEIEAQLNNYKKDVEEVNRRSSSSTDLIGNTKHLMDAVNSLPELTERKQVIDKHTNIATFLLGEIKERSLDVYTTKEKDMMMGGARINLTDLLSVLKTKGTKMDKLRFAIIYLLSSDTLNQADVKAVELALREAEADTSAFQYLKKIKSLNVVSSAANSASRSNIVDWAEMLYDQSINAVTSGVKNLLTGDQQLAVARTVAALAEGKPNPETDSYLFLDPRASKACTTSHVMGRSFSEAIVFMVGGGNYIEYSGLQELSQQPQGTLKNIIYGATEILNATQIIEQLAILGQNMGLG